jgi:hypothetical protein
MVVDVVFKVCWSGILGDRHGIRVLQLVQNDRKTLKLMAEKKSFCESRASVACGLT